MPAQRHQTVLLFGPPGSGKGTQGKVLGCIPGFLHVSMGDVFRALDRGSRLGKIFSEASNRGELVPDDVTISIWKEHIQRLAAQGRYNPETQILVLDGIPRSVNQAKLLENEIDVLRVIHLICGDDERMVKRLRGRAMRENRVDDAREEVIRRRLVVYKSETQPLLEHYPARLITNVDAIGTPAEVLARVLASLAPIQRERFGNVLEESADQ